MSFLEDVCLSFHVGHDIKHLKSVECSLFPSVQICWNLDVDYLTCLVRCSGSVNHSLFTESLALPYCTQEGTLPLSYHIGF